MLRTFADLKRMSIGATDGEIGTVNDAYFDDQHWTLRYLVVDTGGWLTGRRVLITPPSIISSSWSEQLLRLNLTREQIRKSPEIATDQPVSRQQEMAYYDHFGYPYYWSGPFMWGPTSFPAGMGAPLGHIPPFPESASQERKHAEGDPHLRSANEVAGYHIEATDGSIGHIEDFLFDESDWSLRYLVIDTRNWLPGGRRVLISTEWVDEVSWSERRAYVSLTRDAVRSSPAYDHDDLSENDEETLYKHYGRTVGRDMTRGAQIR